MTRCRNAWVRTVAAFATAGMLLQTGGCTVDPNGLIQDLLGMTFNTVLGGVVCNAFGVPESACGVGTSFF